jgi:Ca2+-binding EF-hand superfamily protein
MSSKGIIIGIGIIVGATGCATVERYAGLDGGMSALDTNGDGVLSEQEAGADAALGGQFARIDTNQDSNINPNELKAAQAGVAEIDFDEVDFNGDGVISEEEADFVRPSLSERFDDVDADEDGNVSETEYEASRINLLAETEFAAFDTDTDGVIDSTEAAENQTLGDTFSQLDINGDGMIDGQEFERAQER